MKAALLLLSLATCLPGAKNLIEVSDPVRDYTLRIARYHETDAPDVTDLLRTVHLVRFRADLNADGLQDMAVSDTMSWMKNEGGDWWLYLRQTNGLFVPCGKPLHFHPLAIHVSPQGQGQARITCYHRIDAASGVLAAYLLADSEWTALSRRVIRPADNPGDNREYQRFFEHLLQNPVSEFCVLADYLVNAGCLWKKGY